MADANLLMEDTVAAVFERVAPKIEAIPLPAGYQMEWGGEYESKVKAQTALFSTIPLGLLVMFVITVFLFNTIRQPYCYMGSGSSVHSRGHHGVVVAG
jgi:Cu/Ag efflux pump CusA